MAARRKTNTASNIKDGTKPRLKRHWRTLFLAELAETSNVAKSARHAGVNPARAYKLRRDDPEFAREWLAALWEGYAHLEMEVLRRLRDGDLHAGSSTGASDRYDFANAIRLLAAHRDNAVRAQAQQRNVSAAEVRASIDRKVEAIRQQIRREKIEQASRK